MNRHHEVEKACVGSGVLHLLVNGNPVERDLRQLSSVLASTTPAELETFEVSPSGYGIHRPLIDEDISIDGLLGVAHKVLETRRSA